MTTPKLDRSDPRVYRYDRVDYLTTISHLRPVCSEDGIHFREQDAIPPLIGEGPLESYGIEDCRVAQIGEDYYLTYTAVSANGVDVGLRSTRDWRLFTGHGLIFPPHNKDCAIFTETLAIPLTESSSLRLRKLPPAAPPPSRCHRP